MGDLRRILFELICPVDILATGHTKSRLATPVITQSLSSGRKASVAAILIVVAKRGFKRRIWSNKTILTSGCPNFKVSIK